MYQFKSKAAPTTSDKPKEKTMCVRVYSGSALIEEVRCASQAQLAKVASYWQDQGFRVRIG